MIEYIVEHVQDPAFWAGLGQIILIDILLSGDNAVVIALAVRSLPPHQQKRGVILGAGAAIVLRVIFATVVVELLKIPFLKLVGGALLLWIAVKLLLPEDEGEGGHGDPAANLWQAIRTIVIADAVMSLDNVVAIAAAADGSVVLLILGLLISIPLIVYGSTLVLRLIDRYPIIILGGGALLGWISGDIAVTDPTVVDWIDRSAPWLHQAAPVAGALGVIAVGTWLARRLRARQAAMRRVVDLAKEEPS